MGDPRNPEKLSDFDTDRLGRVSDKQKLLRAHINDKRPLTEDEIVALAADEEYIIRQARVNRDVFNAYVLEDENGDSLVPGHIHYTWNAHIEACVKAGLYAGILAPFGHGKTESAVIGGALFDLGRNPWMRHSIICNSDINAQARIAAIKQYIEKSERYRRVFPEIEPDYKRGWSGHRLFVKRSGQSKDPSISSWGITGGGTGIRCDKITFDDICDFKNTIAEPKQRETIRESVKSQWLSRLDAKPGRKLNYVETLWIATVWHEEDATSAFAMKNSQFLFLVQAISEPGMDRIECKIPAKGKTWHIPLWTAKYNREELQKKRRTLGERAFARGFRQQPYTNTDTAMKSFIKCLDYSITPQEAMSMYGQNWRIVTGVDPAGDKRQGFALFTLACERNKNIRIPLDIRVGAWNGTEAMQQIATVARDYNPDVFIVENNAVQGRILNWIQDAAGGRILTKPFQTGSNKADPTAGIPGMDIEFSNGLWVVALGHVDHRDAADKARGYGLYDDSTLICDCPWCRWIKEVLHYPVFGSADILMASWFAREEVRHGLSLDDLIQGVTGLGSRTSGSGDSAMKAAQSLRGDGGGEFKPTLIHGGRMKERIGAGGW